MKAFGGLEVQLRSFLTPALQEGSEVYGPTRYIWNTPLFPTGHAVYNC
jgi:hypothetical protein